MWQFQNIWPTLFFGIAGGLVITIGYWLWISVQAWRHFSAKPDYVGPGQLWLWNLQQLVQNSNFLRLFAVAASLCALFAALIQKL